MEINQNEVKIRVSRIKSLIWTLIALGLLSVLLWAFLKVWTLTNGFNKEFLQTGIIIMIIVSCLGCYSGFKKLIDNQAGLIIDNNGIQINIGPNRGQFVKWNEIKGFKIDNPISGPVFFLVFVKNPNDFLNQLKGFRRFLLKMNNISHKTPISLTSNFLDCSFEELVTLIEDKYKKNANS